MAVDAGIEPQADSKQKKARPRSPNYPGIGLETAIERAKTLYAREQRNPTNVEVIIGHWGFKPKSGAGMVALAALKKFGLLIDEGSGTGRRAKLSDAALSILLDEPNSSARIALIKQAALLPQIHAELWREHKGSLPSDVSLRRDLIVNRHFTASGADEFISEFRGTLAFAKLTQADKLTGNAQDKNDPKPDDEPLSAAPPVVKPPTEIPTVTQPQQTTQKLGQPVREMSVPVAPDEWVMLRAAFPLSEAKWKQLFAVLDAMKPALVEPADKTGT